MGIGIFTCHFIHVYVKGIQGIRTTHQCNINRNQKRNQVFDNVYVFQSNLYLYATESFFFFIKQLEHMSARTMSSFQADFKESCAKQKKNRKSGK